MLRKFGSILLLASAAIVVACGPNQRIIESGKQNSEPTPEVNSSPKVTSLEEDIQAMKNADFYLIYVFRRKDGAVMDTEDRRFASDHIPPEINRRMVSDQGKAILIGSNFKLPEDSMNALKERFDLTDLSTTQLPETPKR